MDESVELKDILSLFNDECFLFSGWSLMDKCFDVLISIMEKKLWTNEYVSDQGCPSTHHNP